MVPAFVGGYKFMDVKSMQVFFRWEGKACLGCIGILIRFIRMMMVAVCMVMIFFTGMGDHFLVFMMMVGMGNNKMKHHDEDDA